MLDGVCKVRLFINVIKQIRFVAIEKTVTKVLKRRNNVMFFNDASLKMLSSKAQDILLSSVSTTSLVLAINGPSVKVN